MTAGQGALYGGSYVARWWQWLQGVSPDAKHDLRNPAFGGSTSGGRAQLQLQLRTGRGSGARVCCRGGGVAAWQAGGGGSLTRMHACPHTHPTTPGIFTVCINDMVQKDVDLVGAGRGGGGWALEGGRQRGRAHPVQPVSSSCTQSHPNYTQQINEP